MSTASASGDTIVATATAPGRAGVAVTRLSGPAARTAVLALCGHLPEPRYAQRASFRHPDSGDIMDDGLVLWFPGPASFTGEDCVEFQGHGGRAVLEALISALCTLDGV
ncbi:MAG: tRNA uridine-5-carboxymethylaminomethyl(34) synthesis GTPase MnmE, partial [Bacteroidetes bacterium]|nr:tRNA uridine-5-carboxymethylaminomethyl(34) synthesis GTPase MnmE [Bacteroidota bacterium]